MLIDLGAYAEKKLQVPRKYGKLSDLIIRKIQAARIYGGQPGLTYHIVKCPDLGFRSGTWKKIRI